MYKFWLTVFCLFNSIHAVYLRWFRNYWRCSPIMGSPKLQGQLAAASVPRTRPNFGGSGEQLAIVDRTRFDSFTVLFDSFEKFEVWIDSFNDWNYSFKVWIDSFWSTVFDDWLFLHFLYTNTIYYRMIFTTGAAITACTTSSARPMPILTMRSADSSLPTSAGCCAKSILRWWSVARQSTWAIYSKIPLSFTNESIDLKKKESILFNEYRS